MRMWKKIVLVFLFASMPVLMAQVSGPTTRTPRLTVSPGNLTVAGTANLQGDTQGTTATFSGAVSVGALTASGCTGCGSILSQAEGLAFTNGCSNDPAFTAQFIYLSDVSGAVLVGVKIANDVAITCTSDGTDLATAAAAVPAIFRPTDQTQQLRGSVLSISGVQTSACITITTGGTLAFRTGLLCDTLPGNVAKVISIGSQSTLFYNRQAI